MSQMPGVEFVSFVVVVLAYALGGTAAARWLFREPDVATDASVVALERAAAAALLALAFAVATSWVLAFAGLLRPRPLLLVSLPFLAAGLFSALRARRRERGSPVSASWWPPLLALLPVAAWVGVVLWRGTILPPYNHDALAYHLPRAAIFAQEGRYTLPAAPEGRLASWPCDYELLLADAMLLQGSDRLTSWIGTASFCALLLFAATLAAKWWGAGKHVLLVVVLTAATPIAILHSGLHKNDLMVCALGLGVAMWGADWALRGSFRGLGLAYLALSLVVGSKPSGVLFVVPALPLLAMGAWRKRAALRARRGAALAIAGAGIAASVFLLGGWVYVENLVRFQRALLPPEQPGLGYGAWAQLLVYPYMALVTPFYGANETWAPWAHAYWWLPHNDVWFSHFGALFTILVAALPFAAIRYRRQGQLRQRLVVVGYLMAVSCLILLVRVTPFGLVTSYTRYLMYLVPAVAAATVSPALVEIERRGRLAAPVIGLGSAGAAALFCANAFEYGIDDGYAPFAWVEYAIRHPEDRRPFIRVNRAANALDRRAGPDDHVAFDVGFDTWIYAAYGDHWTRHVEFLPRTSGAVPIPEDASWVVVDRTWNVFFGNPGFTDTGHADLLGKGAPSADDRKVFEQLEHDPGFELVYVDRAQNQALFRRKNAPAQAALDRTQR